MRDVVDWRYDILTIKVKDFVADSAAVRLILGGSSCLSRRSFGA